MARALSIENETHWKSSDVRRIVRAAMDEGGANPKRPREVHVRWQVKGSRVSYRVTGTASHETTKIDIFLPRKGPKQTHHNALIALAAAGIETDTPMLAVSDSYFIANALAWELAKEAKRSGFYCDQSKINELAAARRSTGPAAWFDGTKLIITKYADPEKDGTYMAFRKEKEKTITSAQARIDKYEEEIKRATRLLGKAKRDKKKAQDGLSAAKKRREVSS